MIKLNRVALAAALQRRVEERATLLRTLIAHGEDTPSALLDAYRDAELKAHLVAEVSGKCMYCESKITHVYFGDIEHIKPKNLFPEERLDVTNLGLACALCNNRKGDFWDDHTPLLNPYVDEPSAEIFAYGYFIMRRPNAERGRLSIERLDLNRPPLLERRKERVELLQPLVEQYLKAPEGAIKEMIESELIRNSANDSEYALVVRGFLKATCDI